MRFYEEFGTFLPKIQNRIEQKYKTKLDNFTKQIVLIGNLSDQLIFGGGEGLEFLPQVCCGKPTALFGRSFALCKSLLEFHF